MYPEHLEQVFKQLDVECYNCNGSGKDVTRDCDVCVGSGYQLTGAGVELLNFLVRHRKQIQERMVRP